MKTRCLPAIGALLFAALAHGGLALAGEASEAASGAGEPAVANAASEDTPARRTPAAATPLPDPKPDAGAGPGGAIFSPFSQPAAAAPPTGPVAVATAPRETSWGATVVAVVAGLAVLAYLLRLMSNGA